MKARWEMDDFNEMMFHSLPFAREDGDLIHLGMAMRAAHPVSTTPVAIR